MNRDNSKKGSKPILLEKKEKQFWQLEKLLFTMLKTYIGTHFRQGVNYGSRAC